MSTSIAICIATLRRPQTLERLLRSLAELELRDPRLELRIVVVDNDPSGSARPVVNTCSSLLRWPISYAIESRQGVSYARNTAVGLVIDQADFLAFIDDDEWPHCEWIETLMATVREYEADIVTGPVVPSYDPGVPAWIRDGGFFSRSDRDTPETGELLATSATNNVIVASSVFRAASRWFNHDYGLTGGSDTEFFRRMSAAGHSIVWSQRAVVFEFVPNDRARPSWLLKRAYRSGHVWSRIVAEQDGFYKAVWEIVPRAAIGALLSGALLLPSLLFGRAVLLRKLMNLVRRAGAIAGLFGVLSYEEYRTE